MKNLESETEIWNSYFMKQEPYFVRHNTEIHMIIPVHRRESKVHEQVTTDLSAFYVLRDYCVKHV